jgi:hypothetical protein
MKEDEFVKRVIELLESFQRGKISAEPMIREYENLMANECPYELLTESRQLTLIDEFQTELALYVEKPELRAESKQYYGPEELKKKVDEFLGSFPRPKQD